jgi:ribosomal protein S10
MRETRFIQQNKDKWAEFENMLKKRNLDINMKQEKVDFRSYTNTKSIER